MTNPLTQAQMAQAVALQCEKMHHAFMAVVGGSIDPIDRYLNSEAREEEREELRRLVRNLKGNMQDTYGVDIMELLEIAEQEIEW